MHKLLHRFYCTGVYVCIVICVTVCMCGPWSKVMRDIGNNVPFQTHPKRNDQTFCNGVEREREGRLTALVGVVVVLGHVVAHGLLLPEVVFICLAISPRTGAYPPFKRPSSQHLTTNCNKERHNISYVNLQGVERPHMLTTGNK